MRRIALAIALCGCAPELLLEDGGPDGTVADARPDQAIPADMAIPDRARPEPEAPQPEPEAPQPEAPQPEAPQPEPEAPQPEPEAPQPEPEAPQPEPSPDPEPEGPARYPGGRLVSPLTPHAADTLQRFIAGSGPRDAHVFSKIGASATVSAHYLHCFAGADVNLAGRDRLQSTIDWFLEGEVEGVSPFERQSESTVVGWHAGRALEGDPSALEREIAAANPRFATIMYGTNDVGIVNLDTYGDNLLTLVDQLLNNGVIPVVSTVMARGDSAEQDAKIPALNLAVRAVAQARQIPLVDLHLALSALPDLGLADDLIHPTVYRNPDGQRRACDFSEAGLQAGYNWRNLLTLEAFHGLVEVLLRGAAPLDPPSPLLRGAGTAVSPIEIDALPFVDARSTVDGPSDLLDRYPGCNADQNESGPEWVYRFELNAPAIVQAIVLDRGSVDVDLHLLSAVEPDACLVRGHTQIEASLEPGTYYLVADTFVSGGGAERTGDYLLGVIALPAE